MNTETYTSTNVSTIAVIGLGLMGASILKSIQKYSPTVQRYGWSNGNELVSAIESKLINHTSSLKECVTNADLIVIATPITEISAIATDICKYLKKNATIIEIASVKKEIIPCFKKLNKNSRLIEYVHTHPMGGSEKEGFQGSRTGIFLEKPWLILDSGASKLSIVAEERMNWLLAVCGAKRLDFPLQKHDQLVATISHFILNISHLIFDFVANKHPESLPLAGESFITTTRLASDNPKMINDINIQNKYHIDNLLNEFSEFIKTSNITDNPIDYFDNNKQLRNNWLHHRRK
ncbi:prephenate dehydrogenase/arogenate dehydrogenase family protein [Candidatus Nomurabacteria bacterium]|jgi:prephenate dehydrogenase|nr:prephenate dehydrogenase/arogenate dehydrogenase family protein [Candidatus Saccharibacteria bacterium]MCB9822593.1 prephenate dehydrogenase/arogenate dehydrogenase family protein [Candidatus Nomurabacteria bacterium]MDQ5969536.1 Prephenate dehydrogenase/arogenate dehydrogenase family protein [Patescibacteria group bacterium]